MQAAAHATDTTTITLVRDAIHNPSDARHFMKVKPVDRFVRIKLGEQTLAESSDAVRVVEVGHDLYDPVVYLPQSALRANFSQSDRTTHCPLKGDASYFDLVDDSGHVILSDLAWSYNTTFDFAQQLTGYIAFYADRVTVEEIVA